MFLDAKVAVGSVQSEAAGSHHPEEENESEALFRNLFLDWDTALPATFQHDPTCASAWMSRSGTTRKYDYVAMSRSQLKLQ